MMMLDDIKKGEGERSGTAKNKEEEEIGLQEGNRGEERKQKNFHPRAKPEPPSFQLYNLPHRTSVSRTVTFVGKLALPPTRRTKPLAGGAAHGGARRPERRRER